MPPVDAVAAAAASEVGGARRSESNEEVIFERISEWMGKWTVSEPTAPAWMETLPLRRLIATMGDHCSHEESVYVGREQ